MRRRLLQALAQAVLALALTSDQVQLARTVLRQNATHSWELGTETEALMELDCAAMSVYANYALPPSALETPEGVMAIITPIVKSEPITQLQIVPDGSAGDPASLGVAVCVANITQGSSSGIDWLGSATRQLDALLYDTPRTSDGAISHRTNQVQLWSDFVYMAPPFMAYYGAMTNNQTLLQAAYDQCRLYRQYLTWPNGCWQHILLGNDSISDTGRWATGNAWAAAGMMRVYSTISHSAFANAMFDQRKDLAAWVNEIQSCAWSNLQSGAGLLHNYIDEPGTFLDAASTALMAATTLRYAALGLGSQYVDEAMLAYQSVSSGVNTTNGILSPVVDPLSFGSQLQQNFSFVRGNDTSSVGISPEAQAFVLLLEAAHRDYQAGNVSTSATPPQQSATASSSSSSPTSSTSQRAAAHRQLPSSAALASALILVTLLLIGGTTVV